MEITLWIANKLDRPNVMYRVTVLRLVKSVGNTLTNSNNVDPFQASQLGANGNRMCLPIDTDRGVKPYYDVIHNLQTGFSGNVEGAWADREYQIKIKLARKDAKRIVFDSGAQNIVNSPLALYVIPYDSRGTLVSDNVRSYVYSMCMNYKDI
jgi:hypothetical protein